MSRTLTPAMKRLLVAMRTAEEANDLEDAEIVCDGIECWLGDVRTSRATVNRLLCLTLVSESSWGGGTDVFTINDAGRAVLKRPELADELATALASGRPFTVTDEGTLAPLDVTSLSEPASTVLR